MAKGDSITSRLKPVPLAISASLAILLVVLLAFNGKALFGGGTTYQANFSDASGLQSGDQVTVAGVEVGRVNSVAAQGRAGARLVQGPGRVGGRPHRRLDPDPHAARREVPGARSAGRPGAGPGPGVRRRRQAHRHPVRRGRRVQRALGHHRQARHAASSPRACRRSRTPSAAARRRSAAPSTGSPASRTRSRAATSSCASCWPAPARSPPRSPTGATTSSSCSPTATCCSASCRSAATRSRPS